MISYKDTPKIRSIFKDFVIVPVERMNNMSQRYDVGSIYKEVLIMNYAPKNKPTQIQLEF